MESGGANDGTPRRPADTPHATPPGQRGWTHPSEAGLHRRLETDRRRSRLLVLGLVAVCGGVLVGFATVMPSWTGRDAPDAATASPTPLAGSLAMVEDSGSPGGEAVTGLVVDDGHHLIAPGAALGPGAEVEVELDGSRAKGTPVATDDTTGLVLLRLSAPLGLAPERSDGAAVGDALRLVHFGPDGGLHAHQLTTRSTEAQLVSTGNGVTTDVLALEGTARGQGPLADEDGRLAGWLMASEDGRSMALPVDQLMGTVQDMVG